MKSDLHIELSRRCLVWLETKATGRGIRGSEEVALKDGYVVDAAAISGLQMSIEDKFVGREVRSAGTTSDDYSFVFEAKVSRADFFGTFKHGKHGGDRLEPIANFHFVVAPKGMITPEEVPAFWGLLEKSGVGLRLSKMPTFQPAQNLHEIAYLILRATKSFKFHLYTEMIEQYRNEESPTP